MAEVKIRDFPRETFRVHIRGVAKNPTGYTLQAAGMRPIDRLERRQVSLTAAFHEGELLGPRPRRWVRPGL